MSAEAITRISEDSHVILLRLAAKTGKTQGELIEDALALLEGKMAELARRQGR